VEFEVLIAALLKIHKYWSVTLYCRESDSDISHSYVTYCPRRLLVPEDESDTILCSAGNHSPSDTVSHLSFYFCSAFLTAVVRLSHERSLLVGKCPVSWL